MPGHFSHDMIGALNDTVVKMFWTTKDMRRMVDIAGVDQKLINAQDGNNYTSTKDLRRMSCQFGHDPSQNNGMRPAAASPVKSARLCTPVFRSARLNA